LIETIEREDIDVKDDGVLDNVFGWPQTLCVIEVMDGKYACNEGDTEGKGPDPMYKLKGLAVFANTEGAELYMESPKGMKGTIVDKNFEECREIVVSKDVLNVMFLMHGDVILDIVHVK
jgi:hypothetical protein